MGLHLKVEFAEGATFAYPNVEEMCKVHDTREETWRYLNFFQYCCYITPEEKVKTVEVPWASSDSRFT